MKQSLLNADFKSALNIMNKKRFSNSELDKGRRSVDLYKVAILGMVFITPAAIFTVMAYGFTYVLKVKMIYTVLAWICWGLFIFPYIIAIAAKFVRHKDYGSYFFYNSLMGLMVCTCWAIVSIMIGVYLVRENTAKWETVFQTVIALLCLIFDIPHNIKKLRHELAGKNEKSIYYTDIIFGIVFVALLIYNFKLSTILSENSYEGMLEALLMNVIGKQGILFYLYLVSDKMLLWHAKNYVLVSWYARKYPEETRKYFNIPVTRWYYSNELREKHGVDLATIPVKEQLKGAKIDDYEIYLNDIARINDEDMRGETVIAGFDIAIDSKDVYLICTDKKMYPVYKDNTFNMSVPQISYEALKWYDTDYKKDYLRISDGKLITSFDWLKEKKKQALESILAEHGIPKLDRTLFEVPKHAEIKKDGIPAGFVENYQAALSNFSEDEKEIKSSKIEHDILIYDNSTYMLLTNKRLIFVFNEDDFGIPYIGVDYFNISIKHQRYGFAENLCLRNKNLIMPIKGMTELWKRTTIGYLMDKAQVMKDAKAMLEQSFTEIDMTVIEKLEKAKVDDYEIYINDIARINDVDMRGETVIAGFDISADNKDVYLICTDKKMYPVYKDNTFNMNVPQISYESLKWYDTDKKNYFRISDGKLITSFRDIKKNKKQTLESILAEHGIPELDWTLSEVPKHAEIKKDGIPSEFVENYQAALSSFSEDEQEIVSDKVEHDVIVDSTGVYFLVTNKRFIFVFGNDDFHIPYTSVDYSELSVYKQHYFFADNLCLRDKNDLFMPFSGTSETWKRITTKYLVDLINQSQKDALKGGDVYDEC